MHAWSFALILATSGPPIGSDELPNWDDDELLVPSATTRAKHRETEPDRAAPPPTGRGLHVAAAVLMAAGSITTFTGILLWTRPCSDCVEPSFEGLALLAAGPAVLLSGSIMLIVSQVRKTRYRRWSSQHSFVVRPSVAIGPTTMQIGLSSRF